MLLYGWACCVVLLTHSGTRNNSLSFTTACSNNKTTMDFLCPLAWWYVRFHNRCHGPAWNTLAHLQSWNASCKSMHRFLAPGVDCILLVMPANSSSLDMAILGPLQALRLDACKLKHLELRLIQFSITWTGVHGDTPGYTRLPQRSAG